IIGPPLSCPWQTCWRTHRVHIAIFDQYACRVKEGPGSHQGCQANSPGTDIASPQDVHYAIIRLFKALVEAGILNGQRGKTGKDGEELNIIFMKGAWFTSIDAHYPNSLAVHL